MQVKQEHLDGYFHAMNIILKRLEGKPCCVTASRIIREIKTNDKLRLERKTK
jgi:hypothetical protein